ncbi:phosphoribosylaminoimidazolesuccinocarboxamide synthase [methanotrophic endosymbiont of Bathymodiolus puteoserpentis (Logatchev)]|jgi:phosphoribosylaminoimidazole-succinocarboxamide synthase|uniref:phosphoribosylaminoimidazolesuccinocarboxamide synthase n=1 Tax=methanotrophic endosymbiont of Bathymodiolus puteoserpentis (Logatchev) TaxID=343235 RepID=UPI0013C73248|nr:phosphoribosylaminoimidazolesuccinocarboxamide synthase [methanotrophic endosymbiont of Bathymodiolus puteoserpentis (Logatchev)]SHE22565.1 Phosphoribosylaminoimidazole-succinocarboxamide synthase [methanotrophic endosymbiont of Bathymodiolus puteoserpentis (Logatchev)]
MTAPAALFESSISNLKLHARGKVRDIYEVDEHHLLIVTTDRISAFDVVFPDPIPGKGQVLTSVSNFWFEKMQDIIPNHLSDLSLEDIVPDATEREQIEGRAIIVKKLTPLPVEAIVRGYLIGSGWKDYQKSGSVCGIKLPERLQLAQQLPEAIYTPSTKAAVGDHDENISFAETIPLLGEEIATKVRDISLRLYSTAAAYAQERGIIIADTKFEFGLDNAGKLYLIDEALTPDSSRFWPAEQYQVGISPPSFDKQFIRDYLETLDWDKTAPGPKLPDAVTTISSQKYQEAALKLTSV